MTSSSMCQHCNQAIPPGTPSGDFCCPGCRAANEFITSMNLEHVYDLAKGQPLPKGLVGNDSFVQLYNDPQYCQSFCSFDQEHWSEARLSISGLSCYACIWLVREAISRRFEGASIDISLSSGLTRLSPGRSGAKLSEIVSLIQRLGYGVRPEGAQDTVGNSALVRLGINLFCTMNVMMLALPDYLDPTMITHKGFWDFFRILTLILASIVVTYGSWPYYHSAYRAVRQRRACVDIPIAIAIVFTYIFSAYNTFRGDGDVYFDSVCVVATLLGLSRFIQARMVSRAEDQIKSVFQQGMEFIKKLDGDSTQLIPIAQLREGDYFVVLPGELSPVDADVMEGLSSINYEHVNGESDRIDVKQGSKIFGGAINLRQRLVLRAREAGTSGYILKMGSTLSKVLNDRGLYSQRSDRLSSVFFALVCIVASSILMSGWSEDPHEAIARTVAALLIACPCGFAIAVPLAMTMATAKSLAQGVVIKSQRVIETIGRLELMFFDKTGTLTLGTPKVTKFWISTDSLTAQNLSLNDVYRLLVRLAAYSQHHVVISLANWAKTSMEASLQGSVHPELEISSVTEEFGAGLQFCVGGKLWRLGKARYCFSKGGDFAGIPLKNPDIYLCNGKEVVFCCEFRDECHEGVPLILEALKKLGIKIGIISGDKPERVHGFAHDLGIDSEMVFSDSSMNEKANTLRDFTRASPVAMVGNGFNDCLAMAQAQVSIAVSSSNQQTKDTADVYFLKPGIGGCVALVDLCQITLRKIHQAFAFGVAFNTLGLTLAAMGKISPPLAALLMPTGSIIVIFIVTHWSKKFGSTVYASTLESSYGGARLG